MSEEEIIQQAREKISTQIEFEHEQSGLSEESYDRALKRAVHYRGLSADDAEDFLRNAIKAVEEVQVNFANSIKDQVQRAEMIIDEIAGADTTSFERPPVEEVVRYINTQSIDQIEANHAVDDVAVKMGQIFLALKSAEATE